MAPGDTETLEVTFIGMQEENITWTSSNTAVATVDNGEVTAVSTGTAKITATCGTRSADCNVTVASKLASVVNVGDYVDINIGYMDQMDSTKDYRTTNKGKAWRVLSKDTTTGVVNLISTGHPLKFYHPSSDAVASVTEMNKISTETITVDASNSRGYRGNGFSTDDIKSLFNNISVFTEIKPARYSTAGVNIMSITDASVRTTGQDYWIGEACNADGVWFVGANGAIWSHINVTGGLRPVVSLVPNITITGGSGADTAPYTLNGITY